MQSVSQLSGRGQAAGTQNASQARSIIDFCTAHQILRNNVSADIYCHVTKTECAETRLRFIEFQRQKGQSETEGSCQTLPVWTSR